MDWGGVGWGWVPWGPLCSEMGEPWEHVQGMCLTSTAATARASSAVTRRHVPQTKAFTFQFLEPL